MNNHPDIERAARDLAQAEADLQDARQRHADLLAEVSAVEARLQDVAARRAKVREDLAAGTLTDREAGGLLALVDEDAADLRQLLADAQARAATAAPMAEQNVLSLAKSAIERTGREIAFQALHVRVVELEQAFMQALGTLYEQGQVLGRGRSLSGVYRPSNEMRLVLLHNQPPVGVRRE
ncbi:MAG TPA: hypothetical protein VIR76_05865 [Pusillimonas sp.]